MGIVHILCFQSEESRMKNKRILVLMLIALSLFSFMASVQAFEDGFETGDASKWDNIYGTPQFSSTYAYEGDYGMECESDQAGAGDYLDKLDYSWNQTESWVCSFYFQLKQDLQPWDILTICSIYDYDPWVNTIQLTLEYYAGFPNSLVCWNFGTGSEHFNFNITKNTWISVKVESKRNGETTFTINDVSQTGNSTAYYWTYVRFGCRWRGSDSGVNVDIWFDNFNCGAPPITVTADLENVDNDGADWVFTNWKYYTFNVSFPETSLSNVSMAFTIPTAFEDVACGFFSDGSDWFYESNMSYESRYGEPVLLQAGSWSEAGGETTVTYLIWFQEHVLDVWEPDDAISVDVMIDAAGWVTVNDGLFRIYSKGGFTLNTESSDSQYGFLLPGGTPFSFLVGDDGGALDQWMYNEIWFRDVQHLKLLPEIHFYTGVDAFDIEYGCDYSFGEGIWETGWCLHIHPDTVHYNGLFTAAVWINMTVLFFDRGGLVSDEDLYMYNHGSILGVNDPGWFEIWVDLWVSDKNASSVGAARVNAYEYAMEDNADLWLRWLANNWAPMDDVAKEFQGEVPILGSDDSTIMSSERVVMWRYWSKLTVYSAGGGQIIRIKNFEHFDATRSTELPLTGISSPVFDETIVPVVGSKGLLGALYTMFASIGSWLGENVMFGGLNLWGAFVGFLDTIASMFGQPKFFTNLFNWIAQLIGYLADSMSFIPTLLTAVFQLFTNLMGSFLTTMGELIQSLVNTFTSFMDMMGGAYGVGVNLWDALGISQWLMVAMIFYPIYLIILWDQEGEDAVLKQLTWMFGLLSWIFGFLVSLVQFVIRMITSVIESIPIAE